MVESEGGVADFVWAYCGSVGELFEGVAAFGEGDCLEFVPEVLLALYKVGGEGVVRGCGRWEESFA